MNQCEELLKLLMEAVQQEGQKKEEPCANGGIPVGVSNRHVHLSQADLDRLRLLVTEIRCSNSGSFTPDPRITNDTAEMLTILHRLDTQEDADGL